MRSKFNNKLSTINTIEEKTVETDVKPRDNVKIDLEESLLQAPPRRDILAPPRR